MLQIISLCVKCCAVMRKKLIYTISGITCLMLGLIGPLLYKNVLRPSTIYNKEVINTESLNPATPKNNTPIKTIINNKSLKPTATTNKNNKKNTINAAPLKTVITKNNTLKQISFEELPGWNETEVKKSLLAFQKSCKTFLKQAPGHQVGSNLINLKAKDWHPACKEALSIDSILEENARVFFEKWFYPIEFAKNKPVYGTFTGYYMPQIKGNLTKTNKFSTPIYGLPNKNKTKHLSNYTRAEIDKGALNNKAPVIAWIKSPIERLFLEIEGSGVIKLANNESIYLGYAGENGAPYSSIGSVLIKMGIMTKDNASKDAIKRYLESQPKKSNTILRQNKSFVFFQDLKQFFALGAQGMALTPGYSLAIDKKWIPLGAPLWLATTIPDQQNNNDKKFQRLMIAQDTGGAIKGLIRGDIYWGSGERATFLGEHMKNKGRYWLLLPKHAFDMLAKKLG